MPKSSAVDIVTRREQVLRLRTLFGLSVRQIVESLRQQRPPIHVTPSTISRDLQWWHEHFRDNYTPERFDSAGTVGEALAAFTYVEQQALREFRALPHSASARAKMTCLRTALEARDRRVHLLQDLGLLDRNIGTVDVQQHIESAEAIRSWIESAGVVTEGELVPDAERDFLYGDAARALLPDGSDREH